MIDREHLYQAIRSDITSGVFQPNERLVEEALATKYGVSRSPIREVIRQLESESLVTYEKNKGAFVTRLSIKEVNEIYSLRILLEGYAASLAVRQFEEAEMDALREFKASFIKYRDTGQYVEWLKEGIKFHRFFAAQCGNAILGKYIDELRARVHRYQYFVTTASYSIARHTEEHIAVIDAAMRRDAEAVQDLMRQHLSNVHHELQEMLNNHPSL